MHFYWGIEMRRNTLIAALTLAVALGTCGESVLARDAADVAAKGQQPAGLTLFLADPELGVVGSFGRDADIVYFDLRRGIDKAGEPGLQVSLFDAGGRAIVSAGRVIDNSAGPEPRFNKFAAIASQKLARPLAAALEDALSDPVFSVERTALAALATAAAMADLNQGRVAVELSKSLPARASSAAVAEFYTRAAGNLTMRREADGRVTGTFGEIALEGQQKVFLGELNEDGTATRTEAYSRLATKQGNPLSSEYGGDLVPDGWEHETNENSAKSNGGVVLGQAVMAAQVLTYTTSNKFGVAIEPAIVESFSRSALALRDNLLPRTDDNASADKATYSSNSNIWYKNLAGPLAQHGANRTTHYQWTSATTYVFNHDHRFCNHGACPLDATMHNRCTYAGPKLASYRHAPQRNTLTGSSSDHSWHTCNTGYSLLSYYGHNCNDDTRTQLEWIQGNGANFSPDHNVCNDAWGAPTTPYCTW
jgi:hypothetical protein